MNFSFDLGLVETTMLASMRLLAFLVVAPPFHFKAFPGPVKVALALGLALVGGAARGRGRGRGSGSDARVGNRCSSSARSCLQVVVGLGLGFLVRMVFAAVQTAGSGSSTSSAASSWLRASIRSTRSQASVFAKFYDFSALALLFASNGHQLVLGGLVRSFDALPLGEGLNMTLMGHLLTSGLAELMVSALQIAGPLVVVLFLADVGLGLLTRVAPALNAFALGFPLKILLTLSLGSIAYLTFPGRHRHAHRACRIDRDGGDDVSNDSGDKTEKATPKRIKQLRKDGSLQRSQDLSAWVGIAAATLTLPLVISHAADAATHADGAESRGSPSPRSPCSSIDILQNGLMSMFTTMAPLFVRGGPRGDRHRRGARRHPLLAQEAQAHLQALQPQAGPQEESLVARPGGTARRPRSRRGRLAWCCTSWSSRSCRFCSALGPTR